MEVMEKLWMDLERTIRVWVRSVWLAASRDGELLRSIGDPTRKVYEDATVEAIGECVKDMLTEALKDVGKES